MIEYNETNREEIKKALQGKVVESVAWCEEEKYWVLNFSDGSEISFRFMSELC